MQSRYEGAASLYINSGAGTFADRAVEWGVDVYGLLGCAFADFDNDGYLDVFLSAPLGPAGLYRNNDGAAFVEDGTSRGVPTGPWRAASWGDVNGDEAVDFVGALQSSEFELFMNDPATGNFTVETARRGISVQGGRTSGVSVLCDVTGDGHRKSVCARGGWCVRLLLRCPPSSLFSRSGRAPWAAGSFQRAVHQRRDGVFLVKNPRMGPA